MEKNLIDEVFAIHQLQELEENSLFKTLSAYINEMLLHRFNELIQLLYRVDIDEQKLKKLLQENSDQDAGDIIARMIIERQVQKIRSREQLKRKEGPGAEEEEEW